MKRNLRISREFMKKVLIILAVLPVIFYVWVAFSLWGWFLNKQRHGNPPLTPTWALECWLWEDDYNTAAYVDTLLTGYSKHDIPVRTVILDSPWSSAYNNFEVDTLRYPNPKEWFGKLQNDGYHVVLWMTSLVDSFDKDIRNMQNNKWFETAKVNGYLVANGRQTKWRKGKGGFLDYTNPDAQQWWHGMQQTVYDYGIAGWKLDGAATLFFRKLWRIPFFYQSSNQGILTTRKYVDLYYRNEYQHGLGQNPEFVTLSRAIDRAFHREGFSPIDASSVNWVGDQRHSWKLEGKRKDTLDIALDGIEGIEMAMDNVIKSARLEYNIVGSDVAGFSGHKIPLRSYIRWAQFSAFRGLFLNGGHDNRAPWICLEQELEIIRKFSWLHTELLPYMYTYVVSAHNGGQVLQTPVKEKYHYLFGKDFLVAPIYKDELVSRVDLPKGSWRYFFDDRRRIEGPTNFEQEFPLDEYPVFIKEGAIIPVDIKRDYTALGNKDSEDHLSFLIYPKNKNEFTVYPPDKSGSTTVSVIDKKEDLHISFSGVVKPRILWINLDAAPKNVTLDDKRLQENYNCYFDEDQHKLIVKTKTYKKGVYTIVK